MSSFKSYIIFAFFLFYCLSSFAQAEKVQFTKLGRSEGAPNTTVLHIAEDKMGYIWISTRSGLYQYDGKNFTHFTSDSEDSTSISNNWKWQEMKFTNAQFDSRSGMNTVKK